MKTKILLVLILICGFTSCTENEGSKTLFDGTNTEKWNSEGDVTINDKILTLKEGASLILKKGDYSNFEMTISARTVGNGKGYISFHSDKNGVGGYKVALNNDLESPEWWTKTGSLLGVRNLAKSVVKTDEWFDMVIKVEGKAITVSLDSITVVEYIEPVAPYRTNDNESQLLSSGKISLKSTDGAIEIKYISINLLSESVDIAQQQSMAIDESTDHIIKLHQENFPVLDYHVHLKGLTAEEAASKSRIYGINYALAPNCGVGFPITNDEEVLEYLKVMEEQPFIQAMQGEGREWPQTFPKEVRDKFDYVFTDAMTFTDTKGRRTRLWMAEEVKIENEEEYMNLIVQKIVDVMQEPIDVYVNPTFLPDVMNDRYNEFWTEVRMDKVIEAMKATGKVMEINNRYEIPNEAFIKKAKDAGLKFTFGTNNGDGDFGKLEYCIKMKEACGLTAADMFNPNKIQ